ncbi:MAG: hypothetical protein KGJ72_16515, partial [Gammaproteobacteria bacterium]|nr:hypothetical protein [Gammaproteobacteria bacterium]
MVLRSTPVRRSISRWLRPLRSSISTVIRTCGFKTFNSRPPVKRGSVTSRRSSALGADRRPFTSGVGDFQVATDGGIWVTARGDASKVALAHLVAVCRRNSIAVIDCQLASRHLASLGSRSIPRAQFQALLEEWVSLDP